MSQHPEHIQNIVDQLTPSQKLFCEYRARGLTLAGAAQKAGSNAKSENLRTQGFQWESLPGAKEYIEYLKQQHAQANLIDASEIIQKLRKVFDESMADGKYKDANKAAELLGMMIGAFGKNGSVAVPESAGSATKENVAAFKEDDEDATDSDKQKNLQNLIDIAQAAANNSNNKG